MAEEESQYVTDVRTARALIIDARRQVASKIAGGSNLNQQKKLAQEMVEYQVLVDGLDRALASELAQ